LVRYDADKRAAVRERGAAVMMTVPLNGKKAAGRRARVDDGDYDIAMRYKLHVAERIIGGRVTAGPYAAATLPGGKTMYLHTLITGWPMVDHWDHDGLNCQRYNLRETTPPLNSANRLETPGHTSQYKGVSWVPRSRPWKAEIRTGDKAIYLGIYWDEEEAARAYDWKAREIWGRFACLNFPGEPARDDRLALF
jgi:AP2 domain